ncbi:hypothetical protein ASG14_05005 [Pedobacter sp. Leaf194]|nr:hypothetical protein ASG14_05005 [Pedobacter sp. Leaf194]
MTSLKQTRIRGTSISKSMPKGTTSKIWGHLEGKPLHLIRLTNSGGSYVELSDFGARIVSIVVPDKMGKLGNVVLGFPDVKGYISDQCYLGATIGPFANRISQACFSVDSKMYVLERNDGPNLNHSGSRGMHSAIFGFILEPGSVHFTLKLTSLIDGFPGNRSLTISYHWSEDNQMTINYKATSDKLTPLNLSNHVYFNLTGQAGSVFEHRLSIASQEVIAMGYDHLPTGEVFRNQDLQFNRDLLKSKPGDDSQGLKGFNRYYKFSNNHTVDKTAAILEDLNSGRKLHVFTDYPGMLLYSGDYLQSDYNGHQGRPYRPFGGLALECHYLPDNLNQAAFVPSVFGPEKPYENNIKFKFTNQA